MSLPRWLVPLVNGVGQLFAVAETLCGRARWRLSYCRDCGRNRYHGRPCKEDTQMSKGEVRALNEQLRGQGYFLKVALEGGVRVYNEDGKFLWRSDVKSVMTEIREHRAHGTVPPRRRIFQK